MDKLLLKNRILLILVIVLALLNIATIATIVWQTKKLSRFDRPPFGGKLYGYKNFQEYVINELKLDKEQARAYRLADSIFREKSRLVFTNMQQIRKQMVEEVLKVNPDTARLSFLSKQLAMEHIELKEGTFEFLLTLKKICTPEQQGVLNEHIRKMFEFEGIPPFGKGDRRWKHRHGDRDKTPDTPLPPEEGAMPNKGNVPPPPVE
ncbi:MAG: hypothetical protein N2662_00935 [Bacteroidales bacterium]|nr:hypothetical protein [Bacteroidales bacterium]